mmetsp:Transcript_8371/g.18840  ORF Transcript_8371/g.18840 Transcript_8371/m.18840 type:complete len:388 (+) Transcript_8371:582-1745(+)
MVRRRGLVDRIYYELVRSAELQGMPALVPGVADYTRELERRLWAGTAVGERLREVWKIIAKDPRGRRLMMFGWGLKRQVVEGTEEMRKPPWRVSGSNDLLDIHRARWAEGLELFGRAGLSEADCRRRAVEFRDSYRDWCSKHYAFAVPTDAALKAIADLQVPVVEVGAFTGYWASLLKERGVDVLALDSVVPQSAFMEVQRGNAKILSQPDYQKYEALFLCYPTPEETSLCDEALRRFKGSYVIYIGEMCTGMTGTFNFHTTLLRRFDREKELELPNWTGADARLTIWKRSGRDKGEQPRLPCQLCGKEDSVRQCWVTRKVMVCSEACFDECAKSRRALEVIDCYGSECNVPFANYVPVRWVRNESSSGSSRLLDLVAQATPRPEAA